MSINPRLQSALACPSCGSELITRHNSLLCPEENIVFPVEVNVPILITAPNSNMNSGGYSDHTFDYLEHYKTDAREFDYFEERSGATEYSERRLREFILSQIPKTTTSILDVGSGSAWIARHFYKTGTFICSMDATIINTSKALEKYPSENHAAVVADAFHLPFKSGSFDCIVAAEIIEHVPDPKAFVLSLLRVLKPGGTLLISTPYKEVIRYGLCIHCNRRTPMNAHLHSFDEHKLHSLFDNESISSFTWKAFNNKFLLFTRTHVVMNYAPFNVWKMIDRAADIIYNKPLNIVLTITK